jgi:hypothetical protein
MVKIMQVISYSNGIPMCSLFVDEKSDVNSIDTTEYAFGTSVMTASGEVAFLKSDKTWNWLS